MLSVHRSGKWVNIAWFGVLEHVVSKAIVDDYTIEVMNLHSSEPQVAFLLCQFSRQLRLLAIPCGFRYNQMDGVWTLRKVLMITSSRLK